MAKVSLVGRAESVSLVFEKNSKKALCKARFVDAG
jgi:hypothetical protein